MRVILTFILASACFLSFGQNFTNKGKEFWVGYGHNDLFASNSQDMVVYLSAEQAANVTLSIPGTSWIKTYAIPANTVVVSDIIPKTGTEDCRLTDEGLFSKAVHIESNVPIVAYAHVYGQFSSGAAMLLPVESYGYTYSSINASQDYAADDYSWFYIIASEDNTRVRIQPSVRTKGGRQPGIPFNVNLMKGQVYNVMGFNPGSDVGNDVSGSIAISVPGSDGKCHPITMFSGSSRTYICAPIWGESGGDFLMQQVFPVTAWGARYLTGITAPSDGRDQPNTNRFRIYVSDLNTKVYANGTRVTNLQNFAYYDFSTSTSQYITADKPIMVAQLIPSQKACASTGIGDPEIIFLSPMEQAIKTVSFYCTGKENISNNYVTLTIHKNGLSSLLIDGGTNYYTYDHPGLPDYKVVVQEFARTAAQHHVQSDSAFNAIAYGLGEHESYGYNAGCYINNLTFVTEVKNDNSTAANGYTCPGTPFSVTVKTLYLATGLIWHYGGLPGFQPNGDILYANPTPDGTEVINGKTYNVYKQPVPALAPSIGSYTVPVTIQSPSIDNCTNSINLNVEVDVKPGPAADYTFTPACATSSTFFTGSSAEPAVDQWTWDFGDKTTDNVIKPEKIFAAGGNYTVKLRAGRSADGCVIDIIKTVNIPGMPNVAFDMPGVVCMPAGTAAFVNKTTLPGNNAGAMNYAWTFGDGGTSTDVSPTHAYATPGSYPVQLIAATAQGCKDTLAATLSDFADKPIAGFDVNDADQCSGTPFLFTDKSTVPANVANAAWHWIYGDGTTGTGTNPSKTYKQAGDYTVSMYVTTSDGCGSDTASAAVKVYPVPVVDAGPDLITEPGRAVQLQASVTPAAATVAWTPPNYLSNPGQLQPMASPQENTRYYITATGESGCTGTDSMLLKVFKTLKIPNAFTPNGDGRNDTWRIPGLEEYHNATVQVFNRWGQIVYKSTGYSNPWRGDINGTPLPTGAYYYVIQPKENGYGTLSGMVMIVR